MAYHDVSNQMIIPGIHFELHFAGPDAAAQEVLAGLPELTGTPKQIKWADEIRAQYIRDCVEQINIKHAASRQRLIITERDVDAAEQYVKVLNKMIADPRGVFKAVFAQADAKYWINNRTTPFAALVREMAAEAGKQ